ncbi:hypothetical protein GCM10011488_66620 [Steroidobacter agaridevorans]|nr:hypothetical protein GCM10011488_66620 [Steroidobacter agaridevorans]
MTLKARYREPYNARHSFVSWNLMIGKNLLWVAKQHGHSVSTMLETYGAWIEGFAGRRSGIDQASNGDESTFGDPAPIGARTAIPACGIWR